MSYNLLEYVQKIIQRETRFLRTYIGKVVNITDPDNLARVKCTINTLGWDDEGKGVWCFPSDKHALTTPNINDWVRIGFISGDMKRAYYFGIANEMENMKPDEYESKDSQIIFESNDGTGYVKYDENTKTIEIKATLINLNDATESYVLGNTFDSWITGTLLSIFNAHIHTCAGAGNPSSSPTTTLTAPSNYLSTEIKGS